MVKEYGAVVDEEIQESDLSVSYGSWMEQKDPLLRKSKSKTKSLQNINKRVVVVGPYEQFNSFFEREIPNVLESSFVDVVSRADSNQHPYIDVDRREEGRDLPYWIIDFGKVVANVLSKEGEYVHKFGILRKVLRDYENRDMTRDIIKKVIEGVSIDKTSDLINMISEDFGFVIHNDFHNPELNRISDSLFESYSVRDTVNFSGYREWSFSKKTLCITPKPEFIEEIHTLRSYDGKGNFLSGSVPIDDFFEGLLEDLNILSDGLGSKETKYLVNLHSYL